MSLSIRLDVILTVLVEILEHGLLHDVNATSKYSVAVLTSKTPSASRAHFAHSEFGHGGATELLLCLLTQADEAHKRYCKDWKLADADERVQLLQSAFELAKGAQLSCLPLAGTVNATCCYINPELIKTAT